MVSGRVFIQILLKSKLVCEPVFVAYVTCQFMSSVHDAVFVHTTLS